ncbi:ATP-binding cassette transporter abc4 [Ceratobasidium sp. AG-Ba]|nr:ATP-binding cassette transporter abc4 [Ceratobasidium sp. AG-Ba]QRW06787.1 ATP-binding cassette transporter abc4 [Ceratobasidium sp. AG-Ba]
MADQPPPSGTPPPPTSSYIYPVRSLLSGIQPAPDSDAPPPEPNLLLAGLRRDAQLRAERQAQVPPSSSPAPKTSLPGLGARRGMAQGALPISRTSLPFMRDESVFSAPLPTKPEASSPTFFSAQSQSSSPLARRPSAADSPEMAARRVVSGLEDTTTADVTSDVPPPPGQPFRHYPAEGRDGFLRLAHLPEQAPTPSAAEQLSSSAGMAIIMHDSVDGEVIRGSVHAGSKTSKTSASGTGTGTSNAGTDASRTGSALPSGAQSAQPSIQPSGVGSVQQRSGASSVQPRSNQLASRSGTTSLSETSDEPLVTVRFQHVQDEHGHHVVVGREGRLTRCEDEPIRVPGAVQGFGVLIAIEEDYETGNLVVRQVSENASELLGLTPKYLFSLDCFTQTLPDSQADILWDNVQFLHDPELDANDTSDDSPQVFLLSGWGEPGSGLREGGYFAQGAFGPAHFGERAGPRREWTCWCAAHRPKQPQKTRDLPLSSEGSSGGGYLDPNQFDDDDPDVSPLIVLEFELERDIFNPLYPPYTAALPLDSPGVSSRGSGSTPGSASAGTRSAGTKSGTGSAGTGGTGKTSGTGDSSVTQQQDTPRQGDNGDGGKSASVSDWGVCMPIGPGDDVSVPDAGRAPTEFGGGRVSGVDSRSSITSGDDPHVPVVPDVGSHPPIASDSTLFGVETFLTAPSPGIGTSIVTTTTTTTTKPPWPRLWLLFPWLVLRWVLFLFIPILTRAPVVIVGKDDEDGLPTDKKDKPTGIGGDAIEGTKAEDGATGKMAGEGLSEGEIVVPVVVGTTNDATKEGGDGTEVTQEDATPTAVPATTPTAEKGEVETPGDGGMSSADTVKPPSGGQGTGASSGKATVTGGDPNVAGERGVVTNPSSEITPTQNANSGGNDPGEGALSPTELRGLIGEEDWYPSAEDVVESTTSRSRPLRALERMRRITRDPPGSRRGGRRSYEGTGAGVGTMDVFAVLAQVNDQLGSAPDLDSFLKVVVGVIKDLTQFHRVLVYQFDEQWNGQASGVAMRRTEHG